MKMFRKQSPEQVKTPEKMKIMEMAQIERAKIIADSMVQLGNEFIAKIPDPVKKGALFVANWTALASVKFGIEAVKGKALKDGKDLSPTNRILRGTAAVTALVGEALWAYGYFENNEQLGAAGKHLYQFSYVPWLPTGGKETLEGVVDVMKATPAVVKLAVDWVREKVKMPRLAHLLERVDKISQKGVAVNVVHAPDKNKYA